MTDFQSRMNSFRQGLQDQQDTYNKMATNLSNLGRTALPDKLAQHYDYMQKVGGMTTGVSATAHGGKKMVARIAKYRKSRQAQRNNLSDGEQKPTFASKKAVAESESATSKADTTRTEAETTVTKEPSNPAELQEVGEEGKRAKVVAGEEDDEVPFTEAERQFTPRPAQQKLTQDDVDNVGKGVEPPPATLSRTTASHENPFARTSGDDDPLNETSRTLSRTVAPSETETASEGLIAGAKRVVGKAVGKVVGEGAAEVLGEGIPIIGEAVGLGMLIRGLVKAHRHEENNPGQKLSKATAEPTEQSGGFSSAMLKTGSGAPSIV